MAINFTWDVSTCDVHPTKNGKSNVVYNVHWILKATDDTNKNAAGNPLIAETYGTIMLDISDLSNFTNWSSLDAAKVQGWVETAINEHNPDTVKNLKTQLEEEIAHRISPNSVVKTIG